MKINDLQIEIEKNKRKLKNMLNKKEKLKILLKILMKNMWKKEFHFQKTKDMKLIKNYQK
jgi:hypothetical protein